MCSLSDHFTPLGSMDSRLLSLPGCAYGEEVSRNTQNFQPREATGAKEVGSGSLGSKGPLFPVAPFTAAQPVTPLHTPSTDSQLSIQSMWSLAHGHMCRGLSSPSPSLWPVGTSPPPA